MVADCPGVLGDRRGAPRARFVEWISWEIGTNHGANDANWWPELSARPEFTTPDEAAALLGVSLKHSTSGGPGGR